MRAQLDKLNLEDATLAGELQSLDGALVEAGRRLQLAQQSAARAEHRAEIKDRRERSKQFRELGPFLDKATTNLQRGLLALGENASAVGKDFRHVQMLHRVLQVALFDTPFRDAFGVPDHPTRRSFASFSGVINQWCDAYDANLARQSAALDGNQTNEAA
jgi:hypothetical protein